LEHELIPEMHPLVIDNSKGQANNHINCPMCHI
jgi:hypothetical protein